MAEEHEQPKVVVEEDPFVEDKIEEQEEEEKAKGSKLSSSSSSSSSSSDSEDEHDVKHKVYRLFGREKPVHAVLGGGKVITYHVIQFSFKSLKIKNHDLLFTINEAAEVLLWKNKKISGGVLGVATAVWVLFELLECHLLTLICHCLILLLSSFFFWSKTTTLINKSPPHIPEVQISEDCAKETARALTFEIRRVLDTLRDIALGRDLKKFISVVAGLWVLSLVGSSFSFLTLSYIVILLLHTVPVLYEKYEDKVDACAKKAILELKKHYAVLETKVLTKLPKGFSKDKKH